MKRHHFLIILTFAVFFCGCKKFLEEKSSSSIGIPNSIKDLRAIMDNDIELNGLYPGANEIIADDFFITANGYAQLLPGAQDIYIWEDQGVEGGFWSGSYRAIGATNVVLEGLQRIKEGNTTERSILKGEALFVRGLMQFYLAQVYCKPYFIGDQGADLGIVLRKRSGIEVTEGRSSLKETYDRIIADLEEALPLLPDETSFITRPTKLACLSALARVYLMIADYEKALDRTERVLKIKNSLLDFNTLNKEDAFPFRLNNNIEILYTSSSLGSFFTANADTYVNNDLIKLYEEDDLRKSLYFEGASEKTVFKGFYHGAQVGYFAGMALDEIYLIKAECLARKMQLSEGLKVLNNLLKYRYDKNSFSPKQADSANQLLEMVLKERRKELVCRGLRWMDIKRLNKEGKYPVSLVKVLERNGIQETYRLPPNDLRAVLLIPNDAMMGDKYVQNPR